MKRLLTAALALATTVALAAPASAALRVPQIMFDPGPLQIRLDGFGEAIDVLADQQEGLVWGSTISTNSAMTIQFQLSGNPHGNTMGISKLTATALGTVLNGTAQVFPASAGTGWFAVASFRPGNTLIVNLFDANAVLQGTTSYSGVNRSLYGYYISNGSGTFHSHDGLNADGKAHALAFAGTGQNKGSWWLAFEDSPIADYATEDFDDALIFMESINPTPVAQTSWGSLKARFR
jgi:hypothetical protein